MSANCIDDYNYREDEKITSDQDIVTLWNISCGYYGVPVKVIADIATGLDKAVVLEPAAAQDIIGDFALNLKGSSYSLSLAPDRLDIVNNDQGGLSLIANSDGNVNLSVKGILLATLQDNLMQMRSPIRMSDD